MKIDKKKEFKKKLIICSSLLQVVDPLKIIIDETFINLCIIHKIPIKEELNKLINRQLIIMTTKCITANSKKLNEESAYSLKKITHYKCNHEKDYLKKSTSIFLEKINKGENSKFSPINYFENQIKITHNFDCIYNAKNEIYSNNVINENNKQVEGIITKENNELNEKDKKLNENNKITEEIINTNENVELSDSMKCILDLVKNNNEKKFFIATNNMELRYFLRKIFLVPIIYVSEGGALKIESLSIKNMKKKKNVELKKMKMLKWERDIKISEQKRNEKVRKSIKKRKKKKNRNNTNELNKNEMEVNKEKVDDKKNQIEEYMIKKQKKQNKIKKYIKKKQNRKNKRKNKKNRKKKT
ncbi:conserved Plasmodium protein, unknown function [Plasmodium gallinaceum]|uniref:Uncharacterized protein n=1 Tax=Plasmodium gallinaceum TaxID=5849 RepID=A0A1J1GMR6_PLAGA|nr:conserved Plasmodium protein, unknown function [Plasmodium gallinaceum]CRG93557.1 conserved Plasmodium protein, unknown function [Plasmodium gallinaceum]